jgi:hypothetical protein
MYDAGRLIAHTRRLVLSIKAKGATVDLFEIATSPPNAEIVTAYEVTTTTGYRATLPACWCEREACICKAERCGKCHSWGGNRHEIHAREFAKLVGKTYGNATTGRSTIKTVRYQPTDWAPLPQHW